MCRNSIWFQTMTGHTRKMAWLEGKREGNWSYQRVKWKGHERKMRRTEREIRGTSEGHEKNIRKGGKLNKVNVRQRYDWRKWKKHGRKWKETDRRKENAWKEYEQTWKGKGTNTKGIAFVCVYPWFFFIFTPIKCDHHDGHGHAFRIVYLWDSGHDMKGQWKDMNR